MIFLQRNYFAINSHFWNVNISKRTINKFDLLHTLFEPISNQIHLKGFNLIFKRNKNKPF